MHLYSSEKNRLWNFTLNLEISMFRFTKWFLKENEPLKLKLGFFLPWWYLHRIWCLILKTPSPLWSVCLCFPSAPSSLPRVFCIQLFYFFFCFRILKIFCHHKQNKEKRSNVAKNKIKNQNFFYFSFFHHIRAFNWN